MPAVHTVLGRILDLHQRPVAGARVWINGLSVGNGTRYGGLPDGTDELAVSDAEGRFEIYCPESFSALGLTVVAPGLAKQHFGRVAPDGKRHDLVLPAGAALVGRVLRDGRPVKGINIGVASVDRSADGFTGQFVVGTDDQGEFVFPNLPEGRDYQFCGLLDSLRGTGALRARVVRVGHNGTRTDLGTLSLASGWRVAGNVRMKNGGLLPVGSRLILSREGAWDFSVVDLPPDGHFDLPNVPGESLSLRVGMYSYRPVRSLPELGKLNGNREGLLIEMEPEPQK
jgi:hypothetical protein